MENINAHWLPYGYAFAISQMSWRVFLIAKCLNPSFSHHCNFVALQNRAYSKGTDYPYDMKFYCSVI